MANYLGVNSNQAVKECGWNSDGIYIKKRLLHKLLSNEHLQDEDILTLDCQSLQIHRDNKFIGYISLCSGTVVMVD